MTDLTRRLVAEGVGTAFLLVAVVGSGIMAADLFPDGPGPTLLANSFATGGALVGVIALALPTSGAHLNPAVSLVARVRGELDGRTLAAYVAAQTVGAVIGTVLANVMFELPAISVATTDRASVATFVSEVVATVGLLLVIHGCIAARRVALVPFVVGAWIAGAYWFTSSTSFANPAVTVARSLSDTFTGIAPGSVPAFLGAQVLGALLAAALVHVLYPTGGSEP